MGGRDDVQLYVFKLLELIKNQMSLVGLKSRYGHEGPKMMNY
jgi:hypothetical protein